MLLSYFLMILSLILLIINGTQGYLQFKIYNATHIQFAFIATIFYMFSQSWIMFYFIGSGKTIKETILEYKFDKNLYQKIISTFNFEHFINWNSFCDRRRRSNKSNFWNYSWLVIYFKYRSSSISD